MPFHIFSLILTALSRLAFSFLFSASSSATLSELVSAASPAAGAATIVVCAGRSLSSLLEPFWPRTSVQSCTSLAILPARTRSKGLISMTGNPSFRPLVVPIRSDGRSRVEICVMGDEWEERVRRCWCDGRAYIWISPVCVPSRRWVVDRDNAILVIDDLCRQHEDMLRTTWYSLLE
jgi:hypothetical protein